MAATTLKASFKIVCDVRELLDAVSNAASVVPGKGPKPILSNILLKTRGTFRYSSTMDRGKTFKGFLSVI